MTMDLTFEKFYQASVQESHALFDYLDRNKDG